MKPKTTFLLAITVLLSNLLAAQELYEWHGAELITDTVSNNHHPFVIHWDNTYVYWEKSAGDATMICRKDITTEKTSIDTILYQDGIHFKNPRAMKLSLFQRQIYDTEYLLLYERWADEEGSVYYLKYQNGGVFSDPILISDSLSVANSVFSRSQHGAVWLYDNKILYSNLTVDAGFESPVVIDSGNYRKPVLTIENGCAWLTESEAQTQLLYAEQDKSNSWMDPQVIYESDTLFDLTTELNTEMNGSQSLISFGTIEDQMHTVKNYSIEEDIIQNVDYPENAEKELPTVISKYIPVKRLFSNVMNAVVSDTGSGKDIFAPTSFLVKYTIENISNYPGTDTKPRLFYEGGGWSPEPYVEMVCIWESNRNEHWALAMNKIWIAVGSNLEEEPSDNASLAIKPNPMSNSTTIEYALKEKGEVSIQIYDQHGKLIDHLLNEEKAAGTHHVQWNGTTFNGTPVPGGVYLVKMETAGLSQTGKLIINK